MSKSRAASKCAIIIPNWNGKEFISESINSLLKQTYPVDVIVVENGSSDGSVDHIKKHHPKVILLEYPDNAGFAGGVNRGIRFALEQNYNLIGLFNNDAVADTHWVENLTNVLENNENIAIATGTLYRMDGEHIDSTGDFISRSGMPYPRDRNVATKNVSRKSGPVFGATGGASIYKCDLFRKIGLFDEKFFAYYEDVDISFRAQLSGLGIYFTSNAKAYHTISATSSKLGDFSRYHSVKNFVMLYVKNMPTSMFIRFFGLFIFQLAKLYLGLARDRKLSIIAKSISWTFLNFFSILSSRLRVQRLRTQSTHELLKIIKLKFPPKIPPIS